MVAIWLEEALKGALKLFLNPLFYWTFILVFLAGYQRIKLERQQFGVKVFDLFSEWKSTWLPAVFLGLLLSFVLIGAGVVFSYGTLIVLSAMMIILSLSLRFTLLSPSYTIGLSYIILLFLPNFFDGQDTVFAADFHETNYIGLTLLIGILLTAEGFFIRRVKRQETFPQLVKSERGIWIGEHQLKRISMIPMFLLVPGGMIESFAPYWPLIGIGENSYGLILFPFLLGFSHQVRGVIATVGAKQLSTRIIWLGILVTVVSAASYFVDGLSLLALVLAIVGREWITYRFRMQQRKQQAYFKPEKKGLVVVGVIPGTPAERLGVQVGEVVAKVNDRRINDPDEFYEALQGSGAYFKLEILDDQGEVRFVQSAFYESDHYRLGLLFIEEPHRMNRVQQEA